jgi:hypothetical protein
VLIDHKGKANKQEPKFYVGQNDIEIVHDVTVSSLFDLGISNLVVD